jgi:REP-associated tyrosine transposase
MSYDPLLHHRRSVRLSDWDYAGPGTYYVTICASERREIFGTISDGKVDLTDLGKVVRDEWLAIPDFRPQVRLDAFVVMPNHFHALLEILERGGGDQSGPGDQHSQIGRRQRQRETLGLIVRRFKGAVVRRAAANGHGRDAAIWQRGFYESVVRHENDLGRIRQYIEDNPITWAKDEDNPARIT